MNAIKTISRSLTVGPASRFALAVLMLFVVVSLGCETQPEPPLPPMPSGKITRLPATGVSTVGQVIIDQIYIPRSTRLEPLLAEINENGYVEGVDEQQRAAWNANEIQVIRVDAVELSQLYKAIDKGSSMRRHRHAITKHDMLLETTPELKNAISIDWAAKPNLDQSLRLPPGRTRFLGNVSFAKDDAQITLTPQHHWVRQTLVPRPPLEKVRDGRIFEELTLAADLPANTYLVIFWNRSEESDAEPEPDKPTPDLPVSDPTVNRENDNSVPPDAATNADNANAGNNALEINDAGTVRPIPPVVPNADPDGETEPKTEEPKDDPLKFELPPALPRLGRLLLTGDRANKRLQLVLVIHSPIRMQRNNDLRAPGTDSTAPPSTAPVEQPARPDREPAPR